MNNVSPSALNLTKWMTAKEVRSMTARVMVSIDDLKRQKETVSRLARQAANLGTQQDADDLERVACKLDNEIVNARESVRELKLILASKQ